ncbi:MULTISPECIES: hypothetical protein [unclassified Moraxella]
MQLRVPLTIYHGLDTVSVTYFDWFWDFSDSHVWDSFCIND